MKKRNSAGVDNIPAELVQAGGDDVITALATICNRIWLVRHNERGKKTRQIEEEVERQHQGMDRPGVRQVPEGSGKKREEWRKVVAKSSVMPQRPSQIRDR